MTWTEFFKTHPDFARLRPTAHLIVGDLGADNLQTIMVGDVIIRREMTTRPRAGSDYYSHHRRAKGDSLELAEDRISISGPAEAITSLRRAAGDPSDGELWQCLIALTNRQNV